MRTFAFLPHSKPWLAAILTTLLITMPALAEQTQISPHNMPKPHQAQPPIDLPPPIKMAMKQEMRAILNNMQQLLPHLIAGERQEVSRIAKEIEASYLFKQKLTKQQKQMLHKTLPSQFIEYDQAFHKMAGMLSHVAEGGHSELMSFYYYKMQEACVSCHSQFATHRFPALAGKGEQHNDH